LPNKNVILSHLSSMSVW